MLNLSDDAILSYLDAGYSISLLTIYGSYKVKKSHDYYTIIDSLDEAEMFQVEDGKEVVDGGYLRNKQVRCAECWCNGEGPCHWLLEKGEENV